MIKGVLFDMDGLMLDTERIGLKAWLKAGEVLDFPVIDAEFVNLIRGRNIADSRKIIGEKYGSLVDYDTAKAFKDKYTDDFIKENGVPVKYGLIELLNELKKRNIPSAVATSTAREKASQYLKLAGVYEYFSAMVCGDEVKHSKPDPEIFLKASKKIGVKPENCIVLEDSPYGIEAGFKAGCMPVMIPDLTAPTEKEQSLCKAILKDLSEVISLIE